MRSGIMVLAAAGLLAACNPSGQENAGGAGGAASVFPSGGTPYRLEATITHENGDTIPVVMVRDGANTRMEFSTDEGQSIIIANADTNETLILTNAGGRQIAMRAPAIPPEFQDPTASWQSELAADATRTGACSGAGLSGDEWSQTEGNVVRTACVTNDGIILRATEGGRTVWQTTRVARGPQPAAQFQLPQGVQVMDLGNLGGMMDAYRQQR